MKFTSTKQFAFSMAFLLAGFAAIAQQRNPLEIANEHVSAHYAEWGLTAQDVVGMKVSDQYTDAKSGISRVFFTQTHMGIPVYNAINNLNIGKDGKVFFVGKRFVADLASKVNTTQPVLNAEAAVIQLMQHLEIPYAPLRSLGQDEKGFFVFEKGNIAKHDIKARLSYQPYGDAVLLAWDVSLDPVGSSDWWSTRVDAVNGSILDKTNWTVYCQVDGKSFAHNHEHCEAEHHQHQATTTAAVANGTYNVWPWPVESPIHGSRQIVTDPHDLTASPFGWHDTNGADGAEFTITRGNNVHAFEDSGNTNASVGNEPDGGAGLVFDFPYNAIAEPSTFTDAAVVNLFYWNNVMHDVAYLYGFNEAAGNFQSNNYGNGGVGTDFVSAHAQDGGGTNNANFQTPPDGNNGIMQMFLWNRSGEVFNVIEPASVAGPYISTVVDGWGAGSTPSLAGVQAEVVITEDGVPDPGFFDACDSLFNGVSLNGKIALIDRGGCEFGWKAYHAQSKGAIGVIICNFEETPVGMAAGTWGGQVNIPTLMIGSVDCQTIRQFAGSGLVVSIKQPGVSGGPQQLDGDLDNGIIAHEYGHGISIRLTGGPSNSGCLSGDEQMGEGWSDFMSLITTAKPGDTGAQKRGIGNYADGLPFDGNGIRRFPYTTNLNINPLTYADISGESIPHGVGAVWCTMIWDLYWAMSDEYGWDPDLYNGTGGNNKAIQLVFEGMKIQPCLPGFVDGRNAILAADQALYNGENKCLIWKAFARRGLGINASQGTSATVGDEVEDFEIPCECRDKVSVEKSVTDFINAGEDIDVTLTVTNCKLETRTNVVITEDLPDGTSYKAGSASVPATVAGNVLSLELGDIAFDQILTVTYKLTTSPDFYSKRIYLDDVPEEEDDVNWDYSYALDAEPNIFFIQEDYHNSPDYAFHAPSLTLESRTNLELKNPLTVSGDRPVLRFYHLFNTQSGFDAGYIDLKKASESSYQPIANKFIRNGYNGAIQYTTFVTPNLAGFSGASGDDFIASYIDLSDWAGEDIKFRFRFGTNAGTVGPLGWVVDDIELMDMLAYNGEVCLTSDQGDNVCAIAPEEGTIVESQIVSSATETLADVKMTVFPNPASDVLNIALDAETQQEVSLSLVTVDGRVMMERKAEVYGAGQFQLNISQLPAGFYFVKISTDNGVMMSKVVVE
ncbi:MAG: T9SS-dependent M36 family metallopeptidase [Saprospiraceae bacterium]|jgi:uncharacterized repeat protein (TIGR01451 family)|nr:T9SS-dependent M36 family metallopeptidase [Saprospiraceae bacterium]